MIYGKRSKEIKSQPEKEKDGLRPALFAAASAGFSLIGLMGLFWGFFLGSGPAGEAVAFGEPILHGSFAGVVIEVLRGSIAPPDADLLHGLSGLIPLFLYVSFLILIFALAFSVFLTIVALLIPSHARGLCLFNGRLLLLPYGLIFLGNALLRALTEKTLGAIFFDASSALTLLSLMLGLILLSLLERKRQGLFHLFSLLFSVLSCSALFLPGKPLSQDLNALIYTDGTASFSVRISLTILCAVILANLGLSVLRLHARRGDPFDVLRFLIQFACVTTFFITHLLADGTFDFFFAQPISSTLLILGSLCAMLFPAISTAFLRAKKAKARPQKRAPAAQSAQTKNPDSSLPCPQDGFEQPEPSHP